MALGFRRCSRIVLAAVLLVIGSGGAFGAPSEAASVHTPPPGSPERKAIMDALREMLRMEDVVFVVRFLRVSEGWAWVETNPRSSDGRSRYEPVDCLLRKEGKTWRVLQCRPCCGECEDDPDCPDPSRYYRKLRRTFPQAPSSIFPP